MARYQEIEAHIEANKQASKKALDHYALERKYNKATPEQFFEYMLENPTNSPTHYLYNAKKGGWDTVRTVLTWNPRQKDLVIKIFRTILKKADSFTDLNSNVWAVKIIVEMYDERLRDIEDWKPKRNSSAYVLRDLLNHLFAKYTVPAFLVNGFVDFDLNASLLYAHIGAGKAMKKFELFPDMILSKGCFHHIQTTPDDCTFNEAFRRAQIIHLGGDDRLFQQLMRTRLRSITNRPTGIDKKNNMECEEFWVTVIKFFIDNPMINSDKIPEIIDYIYDQKYVSKRIPQTNGTYISQYDQPNFTMKGRTPMSLINQSDEWHRLASMTTQRLKVAKEWDPVNIGDLTLEKGDNTYKIVQLTKTSELIHEGNSMHNCVATYASSCIKKMCSIFSFRHTNYKQARIDESCVTIEIRGKELVQIRGRYNKPANPYYQQIIEHWADNNNLRISKYAM